MKKGFTVLELLVVIAIIGILSSIVLVSYNGYTDKARLAKTLQWAGSINHSLGDRAVGAWTFDNIIGATVYDDSGNNNNGTAYGGPAVVNGVVGKALSFDGVDDYVNVPSLTWTPTTFSVSWWLYPKTCTNYNQAVLASNSWGSFVFHTTAACAVYVGTAVATRFTPTDLPANTLILNQWQHFTYSYDGSQGRFYKNGILLAGPKTQTASLAWGGFQIGLNSASNVINGLIDDVRIFSAALTQAQIQQHYADGLSEHQNLIVQQ